MSDKDNAVVWGLGEFIGWNLGKWYFNRREKCQTKKMS